jgi:hypothetical protein
VLRGRLLIDLNEMTDKLEANTNEVGEKAICLFVDFLLIIERITSIDYSIIN